MRRTTEPSTPPTRVILSWSGGKDSALALDALRRDPEYDVVALLTSVTAGYDRISIHGVRRTLLEAQARSVDLPLQVVELKQQSTNTSYEAAFHAGLSAAAGAFPGVSTIAFGDLFLADIRAYREQLLAGTAWRPLFPLWQRDTDLLARQFIDGAFVARLVCVDTTQLDGRFAGRLFDHALLAELPADVDRCGERGEFHTFVSDGPGFARPIECRVGERVLRDSRFMYCDLVD